MALTRSALTARTLGSDDTTAVLDVIDADRIPGQPRCTEAMLAEAIAGRSPVDSGWWTELDQVMVDVLCDATGLVHGVVSYARRARDNAGLVLWLHGREELVVIEALLDHALDRLAEITTVDAFAFASALTVGLEGLPVRHRPVTRSALLARRFTEADLWRYMRRDLPASDVPPAQNVNIAPNPNRSGWTLELRDSDGNRLGDAEVSVAMPGLGVLWWIGVDPHHRGGGHGRLLLGSALDALHQHGAREVILFVDDDAPADDPERGRGAANSMYDRAGFDEIDRLCSYSRAE